jgi:predicted amidophosphoribosyltransferase
MTENHSDEKTARLTDEELSRLLETDLDPAERARLVSRLENDPDSARVLGYASGLAKPEGESLSDETVDKLIGVVREHKSVGGICPHCAGNLYPGGIYCPHCGAQVAGNPLVCHKCGRPVRDGSTYCPHCGTFFRTMRRSGMIESPIYLLILGLASIAVAIITYNYHIGLYPLFGVIGVLTLGTWLAQKIINQWAAAVVAAKKEQREAEEKSEHEDADRKTG